MLEQQALLLGGQWNTPLLLPQEAVPPPTARGPARAETEEEAAVFGLSTTVANERLVEQIEAVVGEFLELVKVVTWRARLSFLQTQEGAIAPLVVLALVVFAVLTGDTWLVGEVLLILPFHLLAWYISFRLPRAEQMPMDGKVLEAALLPWAHFEAQPAQPSEAVVGAEANMILQILRFSQVVASDEEIRLTFSRSDKEAHLADALLAGGMTGTLDATRMFRALRAATSAGSTWAPLWLGDVERLQLEGSCAAREEDRPDSGAVARCCRRWYLEAGARGHPDAEQRLASVQGISATCKLTSEAFNADSLSMISQATAEFDAWQLLSKALQASQIWETEKPASLDLAFAGSGALPSPKDGTAVQRAGANTSACNYRFHAHLGEARKPRR
eukprot:s5977_g1.t1